MLFWREVSGTLELFNTIFYQILNLETILKYYYENLFMIYLF